MIDEREWAIAVGFAELGDGVPNDTPAGPLLEAFRRAIEAYEAALWRPIEEAPRDGTEIQVAIPERAAHLPQYNAIMRWDPKNEVWHERRKHGGWQHSFLKKEGAMFRTITPPPAAKP